MGGTPLFFGDSDHSVEGFTLGCSNSIFLFAFFSDKSEFGVEVMRGWSGGVLFAGLSEEKEFLRLISDDFV